MSYCVNCGVELGISLKECPLCNTPVINPHVEMISSDTFFPSEGGDIKPVSRIELAILISSMLLSVSVLFGVLNLIFDREQFWSLYIIGAMAMLWVWFVLPLLTRTLLFWSRLSIDLISVAAYLGLIAALKGGMEIYLNLIIPLIFLLSATVFIVSMILYSKRRSILHRILICLYGVVLFCVLCELMIDNYLFGVWSPFWSMIVLAICIGLSIPIFIVIKTPSLREELRKRWHF